MVAPANDGTPPPRPDLPSSGTSAQHSSSVWKLALPQLATNPQTMRSSRDAAASPLSASSPSPLTSPMSTFANALAMKKRLSDSITDSWTRRRPSLPQGSTAPNIPGITRHKDKDSSDKSHKSRSRASSNATNNSISYSKSPPSMSSSASLATIASTSSSVSSSSYRGLSRRDSYSNVVDRGYGNAPLASIPSRGSTPGGQESPTVENLRHVSSQPIANMRDIQADEQNMEFQGGYWEAPGGDYDPAMQAAADVGMRRMVGITRKISDSRRIMQTPVLESAEELEFEEHPHGDEPTPRGKRESALSGSNSAGYDMSSDEESTSSSVGTKSTSGSSRVGLPQTVTLSHTKRASRGPQPPPLDTTSDRRPASAVDRSVSSLSRPQSSTGSISRGITSSPMKTNQILRHTHTPGIILPQPSSHLAASPSRAVSNNVSRSDSNSSGTSAPPRASTPSGRDQPVQSSSASTTSPSVRHSQTVALISEPPVPDPETAPKVDPAPSSGMYWYKAPTHGLDHAPLRAHTCTLVATNIYVFGGCDLSSCFNELHVFDADSMSWSRPIVTGQKPPPLRAMTATAVKNKIVIFGGGDGPTYYNDVYVYDTCTGKYSKPVITGEIPCKRRAHTACFYKNGIYVFGGGDGVRALNDVWRLDVADTNKMSWKMISAPSPPPPKAGNLPASLTPTIPERGQQGQLKPQARGYHTANMVGNNLIIFGGSDGDECFKDVWVFDVETTLWRCMEIKKSFSRLSHSATVIGSYLFVVGGHDGVEYSSEVLLLNLGTYSSLFLGVKSGRRVGRRKSGNGWKSLREPAFKQASRRPRGRRCALIGYQNLARRDGTKRSGKNGMKRGRDQETWKIKANKRIVTMQWDRRKVYGQPPSGRGYHCAVLYDSRLFIIGGFDGYVFFRPILAKGMTVVI
jgi:N-acetylneuraminic acid mutarotase